MRKQPSIHSFTLIELLVALGVFSVMMVGLMQFYVSTQNLWLNMSARTNTFEKARIALDIISADLQSAYYEADERKSFFAVLDDTSEGNMLAFATVRATPVGDSVSKLTAVFYKHFKESDVPKGNSFDPMKPESSTNIPDKRYTLQIFEAGDNENSIYWKFTRSYTGESPKKDDNPFKDYPALDGLLWHTVIDGVIEFEVLPMKYDSSSSPKKLKEISIADFWASSNPRFPEAVKLKLTLVDKVNFERWKDAGFPTETGDTDPYTLLIENNKRTFTRIVVLNR